MSIPANGCAVSTQGAVTVAFLRPRTIRCSVRADYLFMVAGVFCPSVGKRSGLNLSGRIGSIWKKDQNELLAINWLVIRLGNNRTTTRNNYKNDVWGQSYMILQLLFSILYFCQFQIQYLRYLWFPAWGRHCNDCQRFITQHCSSDSNDCK